MFSQAAESRSTVAPTWRMRTSISAIWLPLTQVADLTRSSRCMARDQDGLAVLPRLICLADGQWRRQLSPPLSETNETLQHADCRCTHGDDWSAVGCALRDGSQLAGCSFKSFRVHEVVRSVFGYNRLECARAHVECDVGQRRSSLLNELMEHLRREVEPGCWGRDGASCLARGEDGLITRRIGGIWSSANVGRDGHLTQAFEQCRHGQSAKAVAIGAMETESCLDTRVFTRLDPLIQHTHYLKLETAITDLKITSTRAQWEANHGAPFLAVCGLTEGMCRIMSCVLRGRRKEHDLNGRLVCFGKARAESGIDNR
mmetsp:Transcript_2299/g.7365  ORF Transcript_2299/g.7365 Transcript_2299/m.7365 type:complete len:315 (-) Transcript_2299:369-1313(-)|eukprot:scaffold216866_cov32-Tisochrysis_lutea.AAC.2